MSPEPAREITRLLRAWRGGDEAALNELTPLVYQELRRLARHYMRRENPGNSLQSTALVNEAYLRLAGAAGVDWQDRAHFFAVSARVMRRILVEAARRRAAIRRGGGEFQQKQVTDLDALPDLSSRRDREVVALDDALNELAKVDPRKAQVIELRFFGGLSVEETAGVLGLSPQTVLRDWKLARAWLMREMTDGKRGSS